MILYQVDMDSLKEVFDELGGLKDKSKMILRGAINDTAKDIRDMLVDYIYSHYDIHESRAKFNRRYMTIKKAKVSRLTATVTAESPVTELYDYKVSPRRLYHNWENKPAYVKGKVLIDSLLKKLALKPQATGDKYKAFVVRYPNQGIVNGKDTSHITVGQRVPGKRMKDKPHKEAIKTLFSPSVAKMVGAEEGAYEKIGPDISAVLADHIEEQAMKFLAKGVSEKYDT